MEIEWKWKSFDENFAASTNLIVFPQYFSSDFENLCRKNHNLFELIRC
jgi:hypothetical protein